MAGLKGIAVEREGLLEVVGEEIVGVIGRTRAGGERMCERFARERFVRVVVFCFCPLGQIRHFRFCSFICFTFSRVHACTAASLAV
jgi:hypothetical protein